MKRIALIALLSVFLVEMQAQNIEIEIKASINYPQIPDIENIHENPGVSPNTGFSYSFYVQNMKETFENAPGGKLSADFKFPIGKRFYFKTGIGLNLLRIKRDIVLLADDNLIYYDGVIIIIDEDGQERPIQISSSPESETIGKTKIIYLEIPVKMGYSFFEDKLNLSLGFTGSIIAYSEQNKYLTEYQLLNSLLMPIQKEGIDKSSDGLSNFVVAANTEISYMLSRRLSVFTAYSMQLNPIFDKNAQVAGKAKYHLFELGMGLHFGKKEKAVVDFY